MSFLTWGTPGGGSWHVLITGPPGWGFDVPLATALCKNLPAENTQRQLSRPKPTRVAVLIEEEAEAALILRRIQRDIVINTQVFR